MRTIGTDLRALVALTLILLAPGALAAPTGMTTSQAKTAAPGAVNLSNGTNAEGTSSSFARADHVHAVTNAATALPTCNAGTEGREVWASGSGGTSTLLRTKLCRCTSDGAASPTYAWQNTLSGIVGTSTTCEPAALQRLPLSTVGCYASGTALGAYGEPITFSRATGTAAVIRNGTELTCPANQLRVGDWGALVEGVATQYLANNCTAPATQTGIAVTNSGFRQAYAVWMEGTGSVTVTAGTAVAYGSSLPVTATAGHPVAFTIATSGTVNVSVTGTVTRFFLNQDVYPVTQCCTSAPCSPSADAASFAAPPLAGAPFCISATVRAPIGDGGWSRAPTNYADLHTVASLGTYNAANSVLFMTSGAGGNATIGFAIRDASNTVKQINSPLYGGTVGSYAAFGGSTHPGPTWGPLFTGTHKWTACSNGAGTMTIGVDGCLTTPTTTGAGTGILGSSPSTLYVGATSAGTFALTSYLKDLEITTTTPLVSPSADAASVGDSITLGYPLGVAYLRGPCYAPANFAVGGTTISQIRDSWRANVKGLTQYQYLTINGGTNDLNLGTSAATIWASFKTIIDEALADGKKVIALTVTPRNNSAGWTAGQQTELLSLNSSILAYSPGANYQTVDAYTLLNDGAGNLQVAYDSGDHVHLSNAGTDAIAVAVRAKFP